MAIKLTKKTCFEKWVIHQWPGGWFYIGPTHGRLSVANYPTKGEAKAALEMKNWLIKFMNLKSAPKADAGLVETLQTIRARTFKASKLSEQEIYYLNELACKALASLQGKDGGGE